MLEFLTYLTIFFLTIHASESTGTISQTANFNPKKDSDSLHKALAGFGTNDRALIDVIARRTNAERQQIATLYQQSYNRDLKKHIASDTSGDYGDLMNGLMEYAPVYDAKLIKKAIEGLGTNFDLLIEVLLTRSPVQIQYIGKAYEQVTRRKLVNDIKGDVNRDVEKLLVLIADGKRDTSNTVDEALAEKDAKSLYDAGKNRIGTVNEVFVTIFATRNFNQLRRTFEIYQTRYKKSIRQAIANEMSGKLQQALLLIVDTVSSPGVYYAHLLHKALKKGLGGTDEKTLNRVFITRSEVDMVEIKNAYQDIYKTPLEKHIRRDVSGHYQDALIAILYGNGIRT